MTGNGRCRDSALAIVAAALLAGSENARTQETARTWPSAPPRAVGLGPAVFAALGGDERGG